MALRPYFLKGLKWRVGDGRSINFWKDNWLLNQPLFLLAKNKEMIDRTISVNTFIKNNGE